MLQQLQDTVWSRTAIHDTVAAIVRHEGYRRSLRESLLERFFGWLGQMFEWLNQSLKGTRYGKGIAIGMAVVLALLIIGRLAYAARLRSESERYRRSERGGAASTSDAWSEAEQLAAEGRFTEAAHALYRATLALLARRAHLRLHPSKTTGDYVRELRARSSPAYSGFRQFGRRYDSVIYGHGSCDAESYASLLADATGLLSLAANREERAA
jgi:uncharacterized protein DUF4129